MGLELEALRFLGCDQGSTCTTRGEVFDARARSFLLVANREDIMKENVWNIWLRDSLPEAFMKIFPAVFANDPRRKLQFTWIRERFRWRSH